MNNDFPPHGKDRERLIQKLNADATAARRNGRHVKAVAMSEHPTLIEEMDGPCCGNAYITLGGVGHLVWSPEWRSEVPSSQRVTHIGVVGKSTCIGLSEHGGITPIVLKPRHLGECGVSASDVETLLVKSGVKVRPRAEPAPDCERVSFPPTLMVYENRSLFGGA